MTLSFALKTIFKVFAVLLVLVGIWYEEEIAEWEQKIISKIKGEYINNAEISERVMERPADRTYAERKRLAENAAYGRMQAARKQEISIRKKDSLKEQKFVA